MILGVLGMVAANAAVLLGTHLLHRPLKAGRPGLDLLTFLLTRLVLISAIVLVAGLLQVLNALFLGSAGFLLLLAQVAAKVHRDLPRPSWPSCGKIGAAVLAVMALRQIGQVWFLAPFSSDALSYHLTKVAEWVQAGGFTREMGPDTHASFPAGFELIETWWVVFLHHDVLIEMAGVEFIVVAFAGTWELARRLGVSTRWSYLASILYTTSPGLQLASISCMNDGAVAALVVSSAVLVLSRASPSILLGAAGLGLGVKPTFGYALPGFLVLWWFVRRDPRPAAPHRKAALCFCALGLALGAFWYARNAVWYGNPIFPVERSGLIGGTGKLRIQVGPKPMSGVENLLSLVDERISDHVVPYNTLLLHLSGWGAAAFACGLISLVHEVRSERAVRHAALGFLASLLCVLLLVHHDPWFTRFILFFPAILSVAVARIVERYRGALLVAATAVAAQWIATLVPWDLPLGDIRRLWGFGWQDRSMARIIEAWPLEPVVGYYVREPVNNRGESYLLYRPDFSCQVVYTRPVSAPDLVQQLRAASARLFYVPRTSAEGDPLLKECLDLNLIRPFKGGFYILD